MNMALAPKLQQKQAQGLTMTPQLQQAIKLLAMTNLELQLFVEEQLESNPLLERGTGTENRRGEETPEIKPDEGSAQELQLSEVSSAAIEALDVAADVLEPESSPSELPSTGGDIDWSKAGSGGSFNASSGYDKLANTTAEKTLKQHLSEQLAMAFSSDTERMIGAYLIDQVDENGYLQTDLTEMTHRLGLKDGQIEEVLKTLQGFEPSGVMARSLSECLALQLRDQNRLDPPMQALLDNLELLARHDLDTLASVCSLDREALGAYIKRLKALAPKPGLAYGSDVAQAVEPDVFVRGRPDGGWSVELNAETLPRVLVNARYYTEVCSASQDEDVKTYMTECAQNASWLVKSLDQRARTILKVASEIVRQQDGFFAYGVNHLRPLTLKTIAEAIDMHESTVSRVTSQKYMATSRGLFELKYFFSTSIASVDGGEAHSAESVKNKIKILISEETSPQTVMSDEKIVRLLRDQGIDLARRTVAKYREMLGIPSSVQRRRILKNK